MTSAPRPAVTPRYGRIAAFAGAVLSTLITVSAGFGLLPTGSAAAQATPESDEGGALSSAGDAASDVVGDTASGAATAPAPDESLPDPPMPAGSDVAAAPPADSGQGRRIVFDLGDQRVWLIGSDEEVLRSYLVSGSISDNVGPGTYEVYSRSRRATALSGSSMGYLVRFTTGDGAAIGFHDIPELDGEPVQTTAQLGTPLSDGSVRQDQPDARALWRFAPVGTTVVVTA